MKTSIISALLSTALLLFWALWVLPYIQIQSTSLGLDFVLILIWSALVLGASWSEINALIPQKSIPAEELVKQRRLNLGRSILLVLVIAANFAWSDLLAGDFWFSYYAKYGVYSTALRSGNTEKTLWAIRRGAQAVTPDFITGMLPAVARLTRSPDKAVKGAAFAWLGYGIRQMELAQATNVPESVKQKAAKVERMLTGSIEGLGPCLRKADGPALEGCLYAAGWSSKPEYLGDISDVVARTHDPACLTAASIACWNIGGLRAMDILADLIKTTKGLPRQAAVFGYLKTASVLVDSSSDDVNTDLFKRLELRVAKEVPNLPMPALCVFLQRFTNLRDARFSQALAQVVKQTKDPAICPDIEVTPPVGVPFSLSLRRDFYECLTGAISGIAKGNDLLVDAVRARISKGGNPRFMRLLKGVLDEAE